MSDQLAPTPAVEDESDTAYGHVMLFVFSAAVCLVSTAVALLALVPHWWMLGVVFAFHGAATVVVSIVTARALTGRTRVAFRRRPAAAHAADVPPSGLAAAV